MRKMLTYMNEVVYLSHTKFASFHLKYHLSRKKPNGLSLKQQLFIKLLNRSQVNKSILYLLQVLITKLRSTNSLETQQYRKGSKALLVLIPLLGITYVLVITGPTEKGILSDIFYFIRAVLISTQVTSHLLLLTQISFKWYQFHPNLT